MALKPTFASVLTCIALSVFLAAATHRGEETGGEMIAGGDTELGPIFLLSVGGKLYDDLWRLLDMLPPEGINPRFPTGTSIDPYDTWRCVTCHGWDYSGEVIAGQQFPSLRHLTGMEPDQIAQRLRNQAHPFPSDKLPDLAIQLLAVFISQGQYDRAEFFDTKGQALGDTTAGQGIFEGACINCHQLDGRAYLRGEPGDRPSLGWIVRSRPEQALHKILNGVPAAEMLSLRFLSSTDIRDLLAYLQTLDPGGQ